MSDRELVLRAAKAAGMKTAGQYDFQYGLRLYEPAVWWNPLGDDGDAFRLAVHLGLNVYPLARTSTGRACSAAGTGSRGRLGEEVDAGDIVAATRRAIVKAAAEMSDDRFDLEKPL